MTGRFALGCWLACALTVSGSTRARAQDATTVSNLEFHSSNVALNASFSWAKQQALSYVHPGTYSIGPWYEAALPGRNAFCMRDVSHQTTGAAALGLYEANHNMLSRFALSAAPSRKWAGYWEIDSKGQPSTADYRSDDDFWFNLPANFDVLDAIVRMWRWTGDDRYRNDPGLQQFFRKTLTDYMTQWQLRPDAILTRPRIANQRLDTGRFVSARGIPSYSEGSKDFIFGADLLAAEYRAIRSFQEIAATPADRALAEHLQKAGNAIQHILETVAWSREQGHYNGAIQKNLHGYGSTDTMILYFDAVNDEEHLSGALDYVANPAYWKTINIEEESYVPAVLFHYGRASVAYQVIFDLSAQNKARREYPEVSYGVIAAIVTGAMGIEPSHPSDRYDVQTLSQPAMRSEELSLSSLRIKANLLDIKHHGDASTRLTNRQGPSIRWKAVFTGNIAKIYVNGRSMLAEHGTMPGKTPISWVTTIVQPGSTVMVSRNERTGRIDD